MSLALSPLLDVKGATAADATPTKLVVGLSSGAVHVYARSDRVLERSFAAGKARVDAVQCIPNTALVAVVCGSRCHVYNLDTRRLERTVDTRSARLVCVHERAQGARLAVASTYKLRILDFSSDSTLLSEKLLAAPEKHRIGALAALGNDFYVVFGSRPKLWRADAALAAFRPIAMLHPALGSARTYALAAAGNVLFVGSASAAQLLRVGQHNEAPRVVAVIEQAAVPAAARIEAASTRIPLVCAALSGGTLAVLNPQTGSTLARLSSAALPVPSHGAALAIDSGAVRGAVASVECDVSISFITDLSERDLREAATLALSLDATHAVDARIRKIQQQYAVDVFENGDGDGSGADDDHIETAMRLFTVIEEQEGHHAPENSRLVVDTVISPFLARLESADSGAAAAAEPANVASTQSVFSARTSPKRKHVLDPIVAYLVYARRHLRLAGAHNEAAPVDTALFRCYMLMRSPLVAPLLRSPNQCDPEVVKGSLLAAGKWRELVWFLRSKRTPALHREALDLLVEHGEPPESIVAYLEQARTEPDIVFAYAEPCLRANAQLAHRLFFEESAYDSWAVYTYLRDLDADIATEYCFYRVERFGDDKAELHETAARLLAQDEAKLLAFLDTSASYRASVLVEDAAMTPRARAVLSSRLQRYTAAIDLYLDSLNDLAAAQKEAEEHACVTYLFDKLLQDDRLPAFLNTVSPASDLSFAYVLRALPASASVETLGPFFSTFLAAASSAAHKSGLVEAFSRVALTDYSLQLMDLRKERYVVTPTSACAVCHKRLGQAVMGVADGEMVHYGCLPHRSDVL